ncbi:N-formylglutamate deformylase [Novosphingobium decolorationis]|uniref:N-formylglutamate deformylase n=1 Tax=Novosphingobium decolorationis TaxID=2698673 RepID=A0ABX8E501_9SPHN|nr:N-formylglutamate deformylase [Novosphingobium decolorationis]QVM83983.1 N-formylglutamate deformylase [Novosphingobium decolorationis]
MSDWLKVIEGDAPILVAFPHAGTTHADVGHLFRSDWLARRDADWWVDDLYAFAADLGATLVSTRISRSVIDLNRDPSGASLYPGQATTELCPTTTFDGEPLYSGEAPDDAEIARRRALWFDPYHAALAAQIERLRALHGRVVLYDAHSIRSHVPRLFEGELPQFNIGTNGGRTCDPALASTVEAICAASDQSHVLDGRFRGGWTTRHYGRPENGVHAIQMELAIRGYMDEPETPDETNWPTPFDPARAAPLTHTLSQIMKAVRAFAFQEA